MTNTRAIKVKSSVKAGGYCPVNYPCRSDARLLAV